MKWVWLALFIWVTWGAVYGVLSGATFNLPVYMILGWFLWKRYDHKRKEG